MTRSQDSNPKGGRPSALDVSGPVALPTSSIRRLGTRVIDAEALMNRRVEMVGRVRELKRLMELARKAMYRRQLNAVLVHGPEGVGKRRLCQEVAERLEASGERFRVLEAEPGRGDMDFVSSLLRSRFREELESSLPVQALVTTLRMLVPTHEVVEVSFTVAKLLGIPLPARHASLEALTDLLSDPVRRRPLLVDIFRRLLTREAERQPLFVMLHRPERADVDSQAVLAEVLPQLAELPVFVASLQVDVEFKAASRKFVSSSTAPGALMSDFETDFMGGEATRITRIGESAGHPMSSSKTDPEATRFELDNPLLEGLAGVSAEDDATLVFGGELYAPPKIFGLDSELVGLRAMPDMQMESLVRKVLEPVESLPDALVGMILTRLEGIPGQLRQHISALVGHGVLERDGGQWTVHVERLQGEGLPSDLDELSRARLDKLPDKHRRLMELASVVGPQFRLLDVLTLMRLQEEPGEEPFFEQRTESRLRRVMLDLQGQDFVVYEPKLGPQGDEAFRFRFERERELLERAVDESSARQMHRILAQAMESRGGDAAEVAQHWRKGGAHRRAALAMLRGGIKLSQELKAQAAIDALESALSQLGVDEGRDYLEGIAAQARSYLLLGEFAQADKLGRHLSQSAYVLGDTYCGADGFKLRAQAARHVGDLGLATRLLELALQLIGADEREGSLALQAELLDELALIRWQHGAHFSEALELADRALRLRQRLGDVSNTARTLLGIGQIQYARKRLDDAQDCFERAVGLAENANLRQVLARAKNGLGIIAMTRGEPRMAERLWAEALEITQVLGDRALRAAVLGNLGELAWTANGNAHTATDLLRRSVELAHSIGEYSIASESLRLLSLIAIAQVRLADAIKLARKALEDARRSGARIRISLAMRNLAEAWSHTLLGGTEEARRRTLGVGGTVIERAHEAERCYQEAITLLEPMGNMMDLRETLEGFRAFLLGRGRNAEAEAVARRIEALDQ